MAEDVRLLVGRNVKRLRIAAGLTQAALAERMGVDRAYVSGLELGQRNPTIVTLWHITKALEVTLKMFFDEDKPRRRPWKELNSQEARTLYPIRSLLRPRKQTCQPRALTSDLCHKRPMCDIETPENTC